MESIPYRPQPPWNFGLAVILGLAGLVSVVAGQKRAPTVAFRAHVIEADLASGYQVLVADLNQDGRPDVIGLSNRLPELYWYENPSWKRRVVVGDMHRMITLAAAQIEGDPVPEIVIATHFGQTEAESEGRLFCLQHQGDPREPWRATEFDRLATTHRVRFADLDGDGKPELINSALTGPGAQKPLFEAGTPLVYYRPGEWKRRVITENLDGVVHGMRPVAWDDSGRAAVLTASFGGVGLHESSGQGDTLDWNHQQLAPGDGSERPKGGASEIRVGRLGPQRFLATIEPWHGHQVVVYPNFAKDKATRHVIDSSFDDGHALEVADFNGDGLDEIVAGYRGSGSSVYIYYAENRIGTHWRREVLDGGGMAAAGCDVADLNGDGRTDIVCIGARTANIKWYENLGNR